MLTGRQLNHVRTIAEISRPEIADEMFVTTSCIKSIEYGFSRDKALLRYYELSLKIMIDNLIDEDKQRICLDLIDQYSECNANTEQPLLYF